MIEIDGAEGEGGGQVLRNACALSLVTGESFRIRNIRGGRPKPGLMRQHVTAVEAACAISGAEAEGLAVGATELVFRPGSTKAGDYAFAVGTAGSVALVLQTVLLPLALAGAPSRLVLEGGTHNPHAPPFDFLDRVFLPALARLGPRIDARLVRHGFYPRGGGRIEVDIAPSPLRRVELLERGALRRVAARAAFAALPFAIAERIMTAAQAALPDWAAEVFAYRQLPDDEGPGVVLMLEAEFDHTREIVSGFGQLGLRAETLGERSAGRMAGFLASAAFAGPHLADQLVLPMALAGGGALTTVKPSDHLLTAANVAERFTGRHMLTERRDDGAHLMRFV
jgi:RNA 3'-terminal phosphate cyclase (ATP)